jgi:hypothetical protein
VGLAGALALLSHDLAAATVRRAWRFMPLEKLNFQTFAGQLHTIFHVVLGDGNVVPLELIEATEGTPRQAGNQGTVYENFSLLFAGPLQPVLEQRIHSFQHPAVGRFEIFIVPVVSRDPSGMRYECIFNRPQARHA